MVSPTGMKISNNHQSMGRTTCERGVIAMLAGGIVALVGCATIDPRVDYQKAGDLIRERTGATDSYDPDNEQLVAKRLNTLLADGLTVDEAASVAMLNNRGLEALFQTIGASRADVVQSGLLTNPSFSLLGKLPEGGGRVELDVGFGQELVDLWQIPVRRRIAEAELEATILEVAHQAIQLAADVRAACYELLALQRAEAVVQENLQLAEQSENLARRQFEAGAASRLDVNLVRTNTIDVRLELIALRRERQVAETKVARLLGLSASGQRWTLNDSLPEPTAPLTSADLLTFAMTRRLDARMATHQVEAAEAALKHECLKVFPSVEVGFELERTDRRALPGRKVLADTARESIASGGLAAPSIESKAQRDLERRQIIDVLLGPSLTVTLPIWDQNQAQIAKARYKAIQTRKEYEDLLDRVASEVEAAATLVRNAEELVRFYNEEALPQANENVEGARQVYQAGEQSILVLIEAQESLILRRRAYVRALGDYAVALAELERAVGGRLPAEVELPPSSQPGA